MLKFFYVPYKLGDRDLKTIQVVRVILNVSIILSFPTLDHKLNCTITNVRLSIYHLNISPFIFIVHYTPENIISSTFNALIYSIY